MREIQLSCGKIAIVDDDDFDRINSRSWSASGAYAKAHSTKSGKLYMHRYVMGPSPFDGAFVDHINGNGLDNRKCNLRWANVTQSAQNSAKRVSYRGRPTASRYKGVYYHSGPGRKKRWQVKLAASKKTICLGYFETEIEAARMYNEGAQRFHGEFARLNEI